MHLTVCSGIRCRSGWKAHRLDSVLSEIVDRVRRAVGGVTRPLTEADVLGEGEWEDRMDGSGQYKQMCQPLPDRHTKPHQGCDGVVGMCNELH